MLRHALVFGFLLFSSYSAAFGKKPIILPLESYNLAGKEAIGFSVFRGTEPTAFSVTLGSLFPRGGMLYIAARVHGKTAQMHTSLEQTGAIAGMSGSPVFIHCTQYAECLERGTLVGALSLGLTDHPLDDMNSGITPAALMFGATSQGFTAGLGSASAALSENMRHPLAVSWPLDVKPASLFTHMNTTSTDFSRNCAAQFSSAGSSPSELKPGSMIAIFLAKGNRSMTAAGTVTWRDGNTIYAFGHPFLKLTGVDVMGALPYPFAQVSVAETIPSRSSSWKIAGCVVGNEGVIIRDSASEISGEIGKTMQLVPLRVTMRAGRETFIFQEEVVPNIPVLTETILTQLPQNWARETIGWRTDVTFRYRLRIVPRGYPEILIQNIGHDTSINGLPVNVPLTLIAVFERLKKSGFAYAIQSVDLEVELLPAATRWEKEDVRLSKKEALPGETLALYIVLRKSPEGIPLKSIEVPVIIPSDILSCKSASPQDKTAIWTCPMHSEVHAKEAGKCPTCDMALVLSVSGATEEPTCTTSENATVEILIQGGRQFADKRPNHETPRSFAKFIEQLNVKFSGQANSIYIQEIWPPKPNGTEGKTPGIVQKPSGETNMLTWKDFADPILSPTNALSNEKPDVRVRVLPEIPDGIVSLDETLKISVIAPPATEKPPLLEMEIKKKKRRFFF